MTAQQSGGNYWQDRQHVLARIVIKATATLTAMALVIFFSISTLNRLHHPAYRDPFNAYNSISPGQPIAALKQHRCMAADQTQSPQESTYCQIKPSQGHILLISVLMRNGLIHTLSFSIDGLQVADLVQRWGRPDVIQQGRNLYIARWEEGVYATATTEQHFSYSAPVQLVTIDLEN